MSLSRRVRVQGGGVEGGNDVKLIGWLCVIGASISLMGGLSRACLAMTIIFGFGLTLIGAQSSRTWIFWLGAVQTFRERFAGADP